MTAADITTPTMTTFSIEKKDGLAIVSMNIEGLPQNVLNESVGQEFEAMINDIEADSSLTSLVFQSTKPGCFVAGADISMLQGIDTEQQAKDSCKLLHSLFQRVADLKITTVAAIDGVCLGGGLELALVFDYRIASSAKATRIGVPEVQLGVLPGGGGTTRLPRMIALPTALDLILTGKQLNAKRAKSAGLVDKVVLPEVLLATAIEYAGKNKPKRAQSFTDKVMKFGPIRNLVISKARTQTLKLTKGKYPAPLKILEVIGEGLGTSLDKALDLEARGFAELLMTPESKQLVNIFFAVTELKKDTGVDSDTKPREINNVGVLGAGLMGAGISYVTIDKAKLTTRIKDINYEGLAKGIAYVGKIVDKQLARKRINSIGRQTTMARLTGAIDYRGFKNSDVVIEAVFESLDLKQRMVADIEALSDVTESSAIESGGTQSSAIESGGTQSSATESGETETIFATNTSAIPIDDVAAKAKYPERIVGMHYFSPVEKMPLLEVIKGSKTADWATATAVELGKKQGKTVIVVNDGPGFYTTRVLVPFIMEAVRLLLEGVSIEEVDAALEEFGMPVGPIKLMDEVGIDVGAHIVVTLNQAFGDRIPLIDGVDKVLDDDRKGKKNGRGFYDYSDASKGKNVDPSIYKVMGVENAGRTELSRTEITDRIVLTMLNEAAYCLHEDILRSARDGDIGAIFGLGFPPFLGGPFRYMDTLGATEVVSKLEGLKAVHGERFTPAPLLLELAKSGKGFYS
ncbi:MAG: 3-hydroxyacyl-CoA dehydrogenase/enoyl-CoA hydratase/3-hydroxybutyryl-CoA epimerase [Arenicella sp.]|jgi:3-hydroxyacyl-CoA dehydrogenase/enoyl-CoA hydratase/3-hydroxybutyryl-CoA epimerase